MKEVKVCFNKQTWNGNGTYYRGCFTITEALFNKFKDHISNYLEKYKNQRVFSHQEMKEITYLPTLDITLEPLTGKKRAFLKLTQRDHFVSFLKDIGVEINENRALGSFNYYLEIV